MRTQYSAPPTHHADSLAHRQSEYPMAQTSDSHPPQTSHVNLEPTASELLHKLPTQLNTPNIFVPVCPSRSNPNASDVQRLGWCVPALTQKLSTRRGWADFTSWGSWDHSTCAARCWRSFISLWWPVYFSLLWFVGEAASEPATPTDSTNWSGRLALWLAANRTLWRLWWRGGHWKNCYPSWIILSSLSTSHWSDSGAPCPEGCFSFTVITTDTGNLPSILATSHHFIQ